GGDERIYPTGRLAHALVAVRGRRALCARLKPSRHDVQRADRSRLVRSHAGDEGTYPAGRLVYALVAVRVAARSALGRSLRATSYNALTEVVSFDCTRATNGYTRPDGSLTHW